MPDSNALLLHLWESFNLRRVDPCLSCGARGWFVAAILTAVFEAHPLVACL